MANEAVIDIKANNRKLESDLDESEALVKQFAGGVKIALAAVAGAFVFGAVKDTISGWISDASGASDATAKLAAVITSTGGAAGYTADQLAQMADELEKTTGIQAESIQQAQALLLTFDNVRGDQFQKATDLATDLATTLGVDVTAAARMVGKALDDPVDAVNALARAGVDFTDEQKEMIQTMAESGDVLGAQELILSALEGKVGGVAEAMGKTFSGQVAILGAKFGDLGETIGGALIPYIEALLPAAEIAIQGAQALLDIFAEFAGAGEDFQTSFADSIVEALRTVVTFGVDTFTYLMAVSETWSMQSERDTLAVYLSFTTLFEDLKHWFTEAMPAYLKWFGENWTNMFDDVANYTSTVVSNMWTNLKNFFSNIWKWLSGEETSFEWKGLTEGFEATTKALPEIAKRNLTDTETYLKDSIAQMDDDIAAVYARRKQEGDAFIETMFKRDKKVKTDFETTESKERRKLGKEEKPKEDKSKEDKSKEAKTKEDKPKEQAQPKEPVISGGQTVGVEELYDRISQASAKSPEVDVNAQQQAMALMQMFKPITQDQQVAADKERQEDENLEIANVNVPAPPEVPVMRKENFASKETVDYSNVFTLMVQKLGNVEYAVDRVAVAIKELDVGAVI
jgi:hypothetical protein